MGKFKFNKYDEIGGFFEVVEGFLLEDEAGNNLPLGIVNSLKKDTIGEEPPFLGLVADSDEIRLVTIITPPYNLVLAGKADDETILTAINYLLDNKVKIPGIVGQKTVADRFARLWSERTGENSRITMKQRIYKLVTVNDLKLSPGRLRKAQEKDLDLLQQWIIGSNRDMFQKETTPEKARESAEKALEKSSIYLWEDGQPVAMAARTRPTKNGIVINGVYTPDKYRKRGYATACVLSLSRLLLEEGYKFCSLYTDLANPTSNSIYQRIGYRPISDAMVYQFE